MIASLFNALCSISDVNECDENPGICQNGGACRNRFGSFSCSCNNGYTGALCETGI